MNAIKKTGLCAVAIILGAGASLAADAPAANVRLAANLTTIELAPVLLAADRIYPGKAELVSGGVDTLFSAKPADLATNAETQLLRASVDHPDLRVILTVSEGLYRIVGRRSAGISRLADLKGKKIATVAGTSSGYFLHRMLRTVGLTEADVTLVRVAIPEMPAALKSGQVDAVTVWEPEVENAMAAVGADAIEFDGKGVYREVFNLNARAGDLADPAKRETIVAFVRAVIEASARVRSRPQEVWPLVAHSSKYDEALIAKVWKHHAYPGVIVPDLLDVMVDEEGWMAKARARPARPRAELARLIDDSVLKEASTVR